MSRRSTTGPTRGTSPPRPPRLRPSSTRAGRAELSPLEHPRKRPFDVVSSRTDGRAGPFALREDLIRYPTGEEVPYYVVVNPDSVFVVPHFDNGDTVLVRQWRNAWDESSWEVPAGTFNEGEQPLACAHRELREETGLRAARLTSLGTVRGAAILVGRAHLYLAEELTEAERSPETYEQDMEVARMPLRDAVAAALDGDISHATSVTALLRAARFLKLL